MSRDSDEVARLRRVVYGPGSSETERADAAAELIRRGEAIRTTVEQDVVEREPAASVPVVEAAETPDEPLLTDRASDSMAGIRPIWLLPIIAGSLVLGALGASAIAQQIGTLPWGGVPVQTISPTPVPLATDSGPLLSGPGDLVAADVWFDSPATGRDTFPMVELLRSTEVSPTTVRLAAVVGPEFSVWVGRKDSGDLCLLAIDFSTQQGGSSCVERAGFERSGLNISMPNGAATWSGNEIRAWIMHDSE